MCSAERAVRVFAQAQFAEAHRQGIDQQQAADERIAGAENQLDDLGGLDYAKQSRQNAEHAAFGAGRHQAGRRRLGIEAAIAGAVFGGEDRGLPFEAENRRINIGFAAEHAGIVDEIARGEIVGAIGNDVEVAKDFQGVFAGKPGFKRAQVDVRIDGRQLLRGRLQLGTANVAGGVDHLALEIGVVHHVKIDEAERANTGGGQVECKRRAESAGADAQHARRLEFELSAHAHLGHDQMARVAENFIVAEREGLRIFENRGHCVHLGSLWMTLRDTNQRLSYWIREPPAMEGTMEIVSLSCTRVPSWLR